MKKIVLIVALLFVMQLSGTLSMGQNAAEQERIEMADRMRQEGKIYVVVAIIGVVLAGLFAYAIRIDHRIHKLENELRDRKMGDNGHDGDKFKSNKRHESGVL